ncbi:hypothetical protein O3P69_017786 [Scylla paramamosain]|uniref:HTH CENPB-type domain-containing protein n=1 Tax=Scylla paramamosain TaxID=85552 RepID=A0AAW0SAZ0_SCYPA
MKKCNTEHKDNRGRKIFLGTELEDKLKNLLKRMEKMGLGPTIMEFQDIVYDYLTANEISTPFKHNRPGRDWVNSFLLRHNMTLKKGGQMQLARKSVTSDPFVIYGFYDMLEKEMDRLNIKDRPECIYNLDETGFPMDPSKSKTIGSKGEKTVRLTHGANRENITVLATCCADGTCLDPLVVFKDSKAGCSHRTNDQSNSLTSPINQDAENNTLSKFSTAELVDELQRRAPSGMKYVITLELKPNETTLEEVLHARGRSATPVVKRRRVIPMKGQVITNEECLKEIKGKEEKKNANS